MDIKKLLNENEKQHRSLPFWSWNDELEEKEIRDQVRTMAETKNGGFFMHARGGLLTEYLSDEWYNTIAAAIDESKKAGIQAWAYDENGWPSGFANGSVPARGTDYQQKWLDSTVLDGNTAPDNTIAMFKIDGTTYKKTDKAEKGVLAIYVSINKYYIDCFNPDTIKCFLHDTHEEYYKRFKDEFGKGLKGFFTDEPQFMNGRALYPWSVVFEKEFSERYGYSITDNLAALFVSCDNSLSLRFDFYRMVGDLYRTRFLKQMYDWCSDHNCELTGHIMGEVTLASQLTAVADSMPSYEFFHLPGIDWLGRKTGSALAVKQLTSAAAQFGKSTISESFALCGWDVSPDDLKFIAGWEYVNGLSMICQHLEGYTIKGLRKRDYPASLFTQLPWYRKEYGTVNLYLSKLGALLTSGKEPAPLLVIHPIFSAALLFKYNDRKELFKYSGEFDRFSDRLNDNHLLHHYGSEVIMERYGSVCGKQIKIGKCSYDTVLLPKMTVICENTLKLLLEFAENGGKIYALSVPQYVDGRPDERLSKLADFCTLITEEQLPEIHTPLMPDAVENGAEAAGIHIAERICGDEKILYVINMTETEREPEISAEGEYSLSILDVVSEKKVALKTAHKSGRSSAVLHLAPHGAAVITAEKRPSEYIDIKEETIPIKPEFSIDSCTDNILTLDTCEYSVDGGEWQPEKAVILLERELLALKRPCKAAMRFRFRNETEISRLFLVTETPDLFSISVNGKELSFKDEGYLTDKSFRKTDISGFVKQGDNEIVLKLDFYQQQKVYDVLFGKNVHESELNKLTYDTEIETIYLCGDFGVKSNDSYHIGERNSIFTGRSFALCGRPKTVSIDKITQQGFWFFSGEMELSQTVNIVKKPGVHYNVSLRALNAPCAELFVNGVSAGDFVFTPFKLDVTELLNDKENKISFRFYSGNRNMLGPHHKPQGELYDVGPTTFTDVEGWQDTPGAPTWTDNYSFVEFGAEL